MRGALALALVLAGCPAPRDVVPETRDVRVVPGEDAGAREPAGYAWVERRPHGAIGVAGTRNVDEAQARAVVTRLADELEACSARLESQGSLVEGAAQYVAGTGAKGTGELGDLRLAPGNAVAANALLCIVAPVRGTIFPPAGSSGGVPALLLEATWGPVHGGKAAPARDAQP